MNWSSVKNLLIAILIAANLFLLFNIARQDRTRGYISESEVLGAVELLAERGLIVPMQSVPLRRFKSPIYESLYSDDYYFDVATTLSGSEYESHFARPAGGFSITTRNGDRAEIDPEFGFTYVSNGISDAAAYTDITAENFADRALAGAALPGNREKALIESAVDFLDSRVPDNYVLSAEVTSAFLDPSSGLCYLLARQMLDGYEVYSHYAICVFDGEELIFARGRWYFAPFDANYNTELRDQVNILFTDLQTLKDSRSDLYAAAELSLEELQETPSSARSIEELKSAADDALEAEIPQVTAMSACYVIYWNANKTALYFIPAWQINHIDGQTIVYNAANGTVYSKS